MGIETFVFENSLFEKIKMEKLIIDLSELIFYIINNYPVAYGFFSIIVVIVIGVSFSYVRELIHYIRYDMEKKIQIF